MEIHEGYYNLDLKKPVVTMGIFDGVHRGHRILLDTLVNCAAASGGESVVITFDPHPRLVLDKNKKKLSFLSDMDEKRQLLEKAHVNHLIIISFTPAFSRMTANDFVRKVLAEKVKTRYLIIGHDHHFGYHGEGNFDTVNKCASSMGFVVEQLRGLKSREGVISSSLIREALLTGNLDNANKWLGYCYSLKGQVVKGRGIGRKLGFPTANLKPCYRYKLIPADGVYAVEVKVNNEIKPGMLSIGTNPTVSKEPGRRSVEVNIFDFGRDIYGMEIEVMFRYRLRNEIRFETVGQLSLQMQQDRAVALTLLV
ncbi:MAG: bifunctional riboflavin kinase/FAD synthetase [Bacteroidales bacterium]|jgi:riboflavin kinase/FMN adenylyltransferase|nr:bifunctional riboflavin kinase/FAD synthetase [Bacteroidales bacterium]